MKDRWRPGATRVFLAVLGGAHTVQDAATAAGMAKSVAHDHLVRLRTAGLVTWDEGLAGTLRPDGEWEVHHV